MKFFPIKDYTIKTKLTPAIIMERLNNNLESRRLIRFDLSTEDSIERYEGKLMDNKFQINRISYHRGYLPVILGAICKEISHTEISIKMHYKKLTLIIIYVWLVLVGFICFISGIEQIVRWKFEPLVFVPLVMFVFGLFIFFLKFGGFEDETKKSLQYLETLFDAEEAEAFE